MSAEAAILRGSKPLISAGAMLAGLMAFLDISIVNVALNDIRANFGTPLDQIAWVSTNNFLLLAFAFLAVSWVIVLMRRPQRAGAVDVSAH
ncbi:MAG: hypothetical protein AUG04_10950 [Deltaproteobacteria bacterium 13_1_20CM_2_69_21]|nr:MAG: hypothetical protein AUH38_04320 [Deltaproteobacteria bacterium 13_1_40CM_68_24]OLC75569.1 MAG: hypothetical protein AUH83_07885 [Deltaproteobacteria bacterium 13_1_40CM_4_68_19]OLD08670.1 MAG: hypothetical protein AUI90_06245 [Deltaproteobacteria bacterium 13_1_40CM_3_69_14]OLE62248.1 MAG: hypothetical protein AUG04_10950 [Deltaproteobacteria bacterium 13_1_20CM_2_69_21]